MRLDPPYPVAFDPRLIEHAVDVRGLVRLWQHYRIKIAAIEAPERSLIRVSTHFFNTEVEVERVLGALAELL
jgi:selenocysteine lyase/cysteine desulfurase